MKTFFAFLFLILLAGCFTVEVDLSEEVQRELEKFSEMESPPPPPPEWETAMERLPEESETVAAEEKTTRTMEAEPRMVNSPALRALPPGAKQLRGLRICLDPGHGGDVGEQYDRSGYKRGPTGLREAVINLRTAERLKELLEAMGAEVLMTREDDSQVALEERVRLANERQADIFLSIHHNSSSSPEPNYTSAWYHQDGADRRASVDVARGVVLSLSRRLSHLDPRSSGVYSDSLMYDEGFYVLRETRMPAVLVECSFFSNPEEEKRLRDPAYNTRIANALFEGLAGWAYFGIPRWQITEKSSRSIKVQIDDGMKERWGSGKLRIRRESLTVLTDGEPSEYELSGRELTIAMPTGRKEVQLAIDFVNLAGNASITPPKLVEAGGLRTPD